MKGTLALWTCVVWLTVLSQSAIAAELSGTVYSSGSPVANITVTVKETGAQTKTGPNGQYQLRLDPGTYTLVVRGREFGVKVGNDSTRFDIQL
jgi:hypothetical protein